MGFLESYVFFGTISILTLTTCSLRDLFKGKYEKIGLFIVWFTIIWLFLAGINKLHLLWLAPAAFVIPHFISKSARFLYKELWRTILGITVFTVLLAGISFL